MAHAITASKQCTGGKVALCSYSQPQPFHLPRLQALLEDHAGFNPQTLNRLYSVAQHILTHLSRVGGTSTLDGSCPGAWLQSCGHPRE